MKAVEELAFAKVNLWLEILHRRDDGFHELETVMHEIDLADRVIVEEADAFQFEVDDPTVGTGEDNLAVKALRALEARVGRELPCRIRLFKEIPAGGGLGGGSSDAAAVLRGLRRLFDLTMTDQELEEVAAEFGSDTSFFIRGGTAMCRGRGERIEPIPFNQRLSMVLILPGIHVPTGPIFRALQLTGDPKPSYDFLVGLESLRGSKLRSLMFNRLEEPAAREHPDLAAILARMKSRGCLMSGSGSTLFLLAESRQQAEGIADDIRRHEGLETRVVASAVRG